MADFGNIFERLELKYMVDETLAGAIRHDLLPYCDADPHNGTAPGGGYNINTLYLETPAFAFHEAKLRDDPNRFKLRVRTYSTDDPANLEVKSKSVTVIHKTRVAVARDQVADAVAGFGRPLKDTPQARRLLDNFAYLTARTGAEPLILVRYNREAYASNVDGYARITFDRRICAQRVYGWDFEGDPDRWHAIDNYWQFDDLHSPIVVELKCETRVPAWMTDIIQRHNLRRIGYSKYSWGVIVTEMHARGLDGQLGLMGEGRVRV